MTNVFLRDVCIGDDEDAPYAAKFAPNGKPYKHFKMVDFNRFGSALIAIIFMIFFESFKVCINDVSVKTCLPHLVRNLLIG